jgi:hypothetical protein
MRSCYRVLLLAGLLFIPSVAQIAAGYERPVLTIVAPSAREDRGMWSSSNCSVMGNVTPEIPGQVTIRLYSVLADGGLTPLGGATTECGDNGQFAINIFPPGTGWPPGTMRVEASLDGFPKVVARVDQKIVVPDGGPPMEMRKSPVESGIVVDLSAIRDKTFKIPKGTQFLVTGQFHAALKEPAKVGPVVSSEVTREPIGGMKRVIFDSYTWNSLPEKDKPDLFGYETQLLAPDRAGTFGVRITPIIGPDSFKEMAREKPDFTIEVE